MIKVNNKDMRAAPLAYILSSKSDEILILAWPVC